MVSTVVFNGGGFGFLLYFYYVLLEICHLCTRFHSADVALGSCL